MRRLSLWALSLALGGIVGCSVDSHQAPGRFEAKEDALARMAETNFVPTPGEDVCADNGWYDDGECDFWCPLADGDCGDDAVCAAFVEVSDGLCRRAALDPCRNQDPDCDFACPDLPIFPGSDGVCQVDPNDPCAARYDRDCQPYSCATYVEMSDGVCSRPDGDLCRGQDPDCNWQPPIRCPAIAQLSDGVCTTDASDPCVALSDPDCDVVCNGGSAGAEYAPPIGDGVCVDDNDPCTPPDPDCNDCEMNDAFIAPAPVRDGVCFEDNDPCTPPDPDCDACAEYIEVSDGVCSRMPSDPCIFQDPDCNTSCLLPIGPAPADGICAPSGDRCHVDPDCTMCAFFVPPPESDGVCDGDPNDPCSFQGDPDCHVVCAAVIEIEDGQCNRFSGDACIGQDPDCTQTECPTYEIRQPDQVCPYALDNMCRSVDPDCSVDA